MITIKEAFILFDLDPVKYFKPCNSVIETNNTLNFVKEIVKKVYKRLALKYHPDSNSGKGSPKKFAKLTEAKNILLDLKIKPIFNKPLFEMTPWELKETAEAYWEMDTTVSGASNSCKYTWTKAD